MRNTQYKSGGSNLSSGSTGGDITGSELLLKLSYYAVTGILLCVALYGLLSLLWDSTAILTHSAQIPSPF